MKYIIRLDRIKEVMEENELADWMLTKGINGESEQLWERLKDQVPLRRNISDEPDLSRWCEDVYKKIVPKEHRSKSGRGRILTCQSAAREKNPYAVMLCSLLRWLDRNRHVVKNMKEDNPKWGGDEGTSMGDEGTSMRLCV